MKKINAKANMTLAVRGRLCVLEQLTHLGASGLKEVTEARVTYLQAHIGEEKIFVRIKSRSSGDWQGDTSYIDSLPPFPQSQCYWVFVDFQVSDTKPDFYVVPDQWFRQDVKRDFEAYLYRHGGKRAQTPDTTHHAIEIERIAPWKGRWDLLGLPHKP